MNSAPLSVCLRPSPVLAFLLIAGHALGLLALALSLDGFALGLTAAGVVLSAVRTAGEALHIWPDSPTEMELREGGRAAWRDRAGRWHESPLVSGTYVSAWLIVVSLAGSGRVRKWIVIGPDAAAPDARRRLRVWLRWRSAKDTPHAQ